jgi:cobalt/nickel transport system permease protein
MLRSWIETYCWVDSPVRRLSAPLKMAVAVAGVTLTVLLPLGYWPWFAGWPVVLLIAMRLSRIPARVWCQRVLILEPFVLGIALLSLFQPGGGRIVGGILLKSTLSLLTLLVTTLALMYRYLHVLAGELERMQRARASRTFQNQGGRWRAAAMMAGQLFVRSTERAERIYAAMCSRGWKS